MLLPSLFINFADSTFKRSDCILAKSHRASYNLNFNKRIIQFELTYSVPPMLLHNMEYVGLLYLWMIALEWPSYKL